MGFLMAVVMIGSAAWGIASRMHAAAGLRDATETAAVPNVAVTKPTAAATEAELVLPGTVQAFVDSPIYARINGYLRSWSVDIGAKVRRGQILAEIDAPEVAQQLRQAEADLNTAKANQAIAQSTAARWRQLMATDSVTRQETDEKIADAQAKDANVASAVANVARLRETLRFTQVVAPFDGTISARKTDVGALINAGSGQGIELFHMVDRSILRVYVQVPQAYASSVSVGQTAQLKFAEYPGRTFPAKLARTADAIDPVARTLLVEFQVDNAKGELLTGGYTEVHFTLPSRPSVYRLPVNVLIFRGEGLKVARLEADGKAHIVPVIVGRDMGNEVEIVNGLSPDDQIILSPPDSLLDGQAVRVTTVAKKTE
jgi:RND family efflux transporter MFP subunit